MQKMIGKMARMYPMLIAMGFMIVLIAFVIGYQNAQTTATYFSESKTIRETTLMAQRVSYESVDQWLPYFKFLGLGLILGGIVMALRVIIDSLKGVSSEVMANLPEAKRPPTPTPPWYAKMMPMVMMLGMLIFLTAFIVALGNASLASTVFAHPLPEIDAAGAGSVLLGQVQQMHATSAWLVPLKFFAISTEFLAIAVGLATIIYILTNQTLMLEKGIQIARGN